MHIDCFLLFHYAISHLLCFFSSLVLLYVVFMKLRSADDVIVDPLVMTSKKVISAACL